MYGKQGRLPVCAAYMLSSPWPFGRLAETGEDTAICVAGRKSAGSAIQCEVCIVVVGVFVLAQAVVCDCKGSMRRAVKVQCMRGVAWVQIQGLRHRVPRFGNDALSQRISWPHDFTQTPNSSRHVARRRERLVEGSLALCAPVSWEWGREDTLRVANQGRRIAAPPSAPGEPNIIRVCSEEAVPPTLRLTSAACDN